jgi:hypothetical protein
MGLAYETLAAIAPALTQLSRPPCTSEYTWRWRIRPEHVVQS